MTRLDNTLYFDFRGVVLKVLSNDKETNCFIESDFSFFLVHPDETKKEPNITISVFLSEPPYMKIPERTPAAYHTKDAVVYKEGDTLYYDSFGKVLVIYNHHLRSAEIYSIDRNLLYEKCYLMIMSRVGDKLDKKGIHRIHAMGVVYKGKAILCLLPMGGGKTTLTLSLLENKTFSLLSEEVPLVSAKGLLYSFPVRMGVIQGTPLSIPKEFLKDFKRAHYQPKTLIDVQYFKNQIADAAEPGYLFIGKRIHSKEPQIIKISSVKAFPSLFRLCVMGMGLPQLLEYILRFDLWDMARQFSIFLSRLRASLALIRRSKTYELLLGYDRSANAAFLSDFIFKKETKE